MAYARDDRSIEWPRSLKVVSATLVLSGLAAGLLAYPWPTALTLIGLTWGLAVALLIWHYPELGIVLLVFLGSRILNPESVDLRLPIGGGLELPDLALVGLAGMLLLKQALRNDFRLPRSRVLPPLLMLSGLALFSALWAIMYSGVEVPWAFGELRGFAYYPVFFLITLEVRTRRQFVRLLVGLYVVALLTVGLMVAQQFFGSLPLVSGQETTSWQIISSGASSAVRIRPPAHLLLYYLSIVAFTWIGYARKLHARLAALGLAILFNAVLLLTFTRAQWLASILAIFVCLVLFPRTVKFSLAPLALTLAVAGAVLLMSNRARLEDWLQENHFAHPIIGRLESMLSVNETMESYSLQTRQFETQAALQAIGEHPVLGVGLGSAYRNLTPKEARSRYTRFTRFLESSYLYLATKMGIPSLAILAWMATAILIGAHRTFRSATDPLVQALSLASLATLVGILTWGFTHPAFILPENTLLVGLMAGISDAVRRVEI